MSEENEAITKLRWLPSTRRLSSTCRSGPATGTWEGWNLDIEEIIDAGEQVLAVHRESGRGKGSGVPLTQTTFCVYTLRDRKVVRIEAFHTREVAVEAAGLSDE